MGINDHIWNADQSAPRRLAGHLRTLRKTQGWSLEQVAERSGVSRATLSRVETAQVSPTTEVLGKLCACYQLPMSRLLMMAEDQFDAYVPYAAQSEWQDPETGFIRRSVSPHSDRLHAEVIECHIPPGTVISYDAPPRAGQEHHLIMLDGALILTVSDNSQTLTAGDCHRYHLAGASRFETQAGRGARYLLVLL